MFLALAPPLPDAPPADRAVAVSPAPALAWPDKRSNAPSAPRPRPSPSPIAPQGSAAAPRPSRRVPRSELRWFVPHPITKGVTFIPGKGVELATEDGAFSLTTNVFGQLQYSFHNERGDTPRRVEAFEVRRARLMLSGNLFGEHNKYNVQFSIAPREISTTGELALRHAPVLNYQVMFDHLRDLTLVAGQYKVPYNRQRMNAITGLNMVDRSLANFEFTFDRDFGAELRSADFLGLGRLRYYAGIFGGHGFDNFVVHRTGLLYVARIEVLPFGLFDDNIEGDFDRTLVPRTSLGVAYAFHDNAVQNSGGLLTAPRDGGSTDYHNATADLNFKLAGFSLQGAFFFRQGRRNPGNAVDPDSGVPLPVSQARNGVGYFVQAGYLIPRIPLEIVGRYGGIRRQNARSGLVDTDELGGGLNFYVFRHSIKLQLDYFRSWTDALRDGDDQVRLQLQFSM